MFFNWLSGAYSVLGDVHGVEETVRENYQRNPQYLFARVNYAELCLRDGDPDGAREALAGDWTFVPCSAAGGASMFRSSRHTSTRQVYTTSKPEISLPRRTFTGP
jgi:hypothetical protein